MESQVGNLVVSVSIKDEPGYLWLSQDPVLAISVGFARMFIEDHKPIRLKAYNICKCVLKDNPLLRIDSYTNDGKLLQVKLTRDPQDYKFFSSGYIIQQIPPITRKQSASYILDATYLMPILKRFRGLPAKSDIPIQKISARIVAPILNSLCLKDPRLKTDSTTKRRGMLPAPYSLLLDPVETPPEV